MIKGNNGKTKIMALLLVFALTLSLAGCGEKSDYVQPYSEYDLSEYVTLGEYKGINVTEAAIDVTDKEVKAEIKMRLEAAKKDVENKEGTAAVGDNIKITYVGKLDGEVFEGGSTDEEGTVITLGSSGYIPGFDDGLIGMKPGEAKTLDLQFPEDYWDAEKAGMKVTFDVELKAIMTSVTPKYDLEFVKENSKFKSLEDYEESVEEELEDKKEQTAEDEMKNNIWATIMDNAKISKYPEKELEACKVTNREYYESYAEQYGMEFQEFLTMYTGMDAAAYEEYLQQYAEAIIGQEMVMFSIAKAEKITISDREYKAMLKEFMTEQGIPDDASFKEQYGQSFEEYAGKDNLMKNFILEEVLEFATEKAVKVTAGKKA